MLADQLVAAGGSKAKHAAVGHRLRRVVIAGEVPHGQKRTGGTPRNNEQVVLLTNMAEVPAEVIAAVYRLRWRL